MFEEINKKLGFGCMRLPLLEDGHVDEAEFCKMIDTFIENGFNYFDTARVYLNGESETAIGKCLVARYPRDKFLVANKLSSSCFEKEEDLEPYFKDQLACMGLEYFDFYLLHAQSRQNYEKYKKCHCYEFAKKMKEEGYIKHVGFSFHDTAEFLDMILTENPFVEFVQLQFNYIDYEDSPVESKACYEVCQKHGKKVVVMEPIRGGKLAQLPENLHQKFSKYGDASDASYAVRFCASFDDIMMVLSGMSNLEQMEDNISYMKEFKSLSEDEITTIKEVTDELHKIVTIPCTGCKYCVKGCPKHINIPAIFEIYNKFKAFQGGRLFSTYRGITAAGNKCKDCLKCGKCENICPQHIEIRKFLEEISKDFD